MGIETFLTQICDDTAVYWGNPQSDGRGGYTYDDPVDIDCRWKDGEQIMTTDDGRQFVSRATVHLLQDVDTEGLLYHGTLAALEALYDDSEGDSSGVWYDPEIIEEGLCIIKKFSKTPSLRLTTEYVRKSFLTPWQT